MKKIISKIKEDLKLTIVISSIIVLIISGLTTFEIKKNIASDTNTGAKTSTAANDTNIGAKTSTAANDTNTGAKTSTAANDTNTGAKTSTPTSNTNTGVSTSTPTNNTNTGVKTSTAANTSKTASSTKTGTSTSTSGSNTNTGTKTTPTVTPTPTPVPKTPTVTYSAFKGYTWSQSDPQHHHMAGEFEQITQFNSFISGKSTVTSINSYIFSAVKALSMGYDADYIKTKFINKLVNNKYLITDFQVTYYKTPAFRTSDGWEKTIIEIYDDFKAQGIENLPGGLFSAGAGYYKTFDDNDNFGGVRLLIKYKKI